MLEGVKSKVCPVGAERRHYCGAQRAGGPRPVLHDHVCAECGREFLRKEPREEIGAAARRKRDDNDDLARGKLLRLRRVMARGAQRAKDAGRER